MIYRDLFSDYKSIISLFEKFNFNLIKFLACLWNVRCVCVCVNDDGFPPLCYSQTVTGAFSYLP